MAIIQKIMLRSVKKHVGSAVPLLACSRSYHYGTSGSVRDAGGDVAGGSKENSYFYRLELEQLRKIQELREKTIKNVKYEIIKPSQIPQIQKLMYESSYPREPMVKHLGLNKGLHSIPDTDKIIEDLLANYNMSIVAIDKTTNMPVGCAINGEFSMKDVRPQMTSEQLEGMWNLKDESYAPVMAIRQHIDNLGGSNVFHELQTDKVFMMKFFTSVPELSKLGFATALTSRVIQLASALGYKGIKTTVSHEAAVKSCLDNGMKVMAETSFQDFTYKGRKVFQGAQGGVSFLAMKIN